MYQLISIVTPLIKKPSLEKENMKNCTSVSILPRISKLLEKVVMMQPNNHLDEHDLREPLQSAYRTNHSTENALMKVFIDTLSSIYHQQRVLLV